VAATPTHLLDQTVTINGCNWSKDAGAVPVLLSINEPVYVQAAVQPVSSADLMQYMKDTNSIMVVLYLAPTDTSGATWSVAKDDTVTVGGLDYKPHGTTMDMSTKGVLRKLVVERRAG
jgi:hypothetical protein